MLLDNASYSYERLDDGNSSKHHRNSNSSNNKRSPSRRATTFDTELGGPGAEAPWSYSEEAVTLIKLSVPVAVATLCRMAVYSTDSSFVGHLGKSQLAGMSLALAWADIIGVLGWPPAVLLNSICSQAIGAGNKLLAGDWLQLSLLYVAIASVPISIMYLFTGSVVRLFTDDEDIIHYATEFASVGWMLYFPTTLYMAIRQYFQALGITVPASIVSALTVAFNIGANAVLVNGIPSLGFQGLGLIGSPLASLASVCFQIFVFWAYCFKYKQYHKPYWRGWNKAAFSADRRSKVHKLMVPMMIGCAMENWAYDILTLCSGSLDSAEDVDAMSILFQIWSIVWAVYWGCGLALQVRIGYHLGAAGPNAAKAVLKISAVFVFVLCGSLSVLIYVLRETLPKIYSSDPLVIAATERATFVFACCYLMACFGLCAANTLEAMGRTGWLAVAQILGGWGVQIPLALWFAFRSPWFAGDNRIIGMWVGSLCGETVKASIQWTVLWRTDWSEMSQKAIERSYQKETQAAIDDDAGLIN